MAFVINVSVAPTGTTAAIARRMLVERTQVTPSFPCTSTLLAPNVLPFRNILVSTAMESFVKARAHTLSATDTSALSVTTRISVPAARLCLVLPTTVPIL